MHTSRCGFHQLAWSFRVASVPEIPSGLSCVSRSMRKHAGGYCSQQQLCCEVVLTPRVFDACRWYLYLTWVAAPLMSHYWKLVMGPLRSLAQVGVGTVSQRVPYYTMHRKNTGSGVLQCALLEFIPQCPALTVSLYCRHHLLQWGRITAGSCGCR